MGLIVWSRADKNLNQSLDCTPKVGKPRTMRFDSSIHHRRSIRPKNYDYSWPGWYYVTLCTKNRECTLGRVFSDTVDPTDAGRIVEKCWTSLPDHFSRIELDAYVIMPNHLHGIIITNAISRRGLINQTPTREFWK